LEQCILYINTKQHHVLEATADLTEGNVLSLMNINQKVCLVCILIEMFRYQEMLKATSHSISQIRKS